MYTVVFDAQEMTALVVCCCWSSSQSVLPNMDFCCQDCNMSFSSHALLSKHQAQFCVGPSYAITELPKASVHIVNLEIVNCCRTSLTLGLSTPQFSWCLALLMLFKPTYSVPFWLIHTIFCTNYYRWKRLLGYNLRERSLHCTLFLK